MKASKRLQVVLDLAIKEQQKAAKLLVAKREEAEEAFNQYRQLQAYQQEYDQGFAAVKHDPIQLKNYLKFYSSLDKVILNQQEKVQFAANDLEQATQAWQATYAKQQNLQKLVDKKKQEEQAILSQQEQKMLDEQSGLLNQRNRAKRKRL